MDLEKWGEFGLAGVVTGALFMLLWWSLRGHREERKEWRDDATARQAKTDAVIEKLTDAINDSWRHRSGP